MLTSALGLLERHAEVLAEPVSKARLALALALSTAALAFALAAVLIQRGQLRSKARQMSSMSADSAELLRMLGASAAQLRSQLDSVGDDAELAALHTALESYASQSATLVEMAAVDIWCVRRMVIEYELQRPKELEQRVWEQSGYDLQAWLPPGAKNIKVKFGVVGGGPVYKVDRKRSDLPWLLDAKGAKVEESFEVEAGKLTRFRMQGTSFHCFVSDVEVRALD